MKNKEKVLFLLLSALLLTGCSSLPLPGSPTESLFILAGDVERNLIDMNSNIYHVDSIKLIMLNQETGERQNLFFHPGDDYIALPLEPGRYSFDERIIISLKSPKGGEWENKQNIQPVDYLIEENVVYLSPKVLELSKQNIGEGANFRFSFTSDENTLPIKDQAMNQIVEEWHYKAWDLSPIIGWEKPETRD